jgi:Fe-S cluster assembly protein SufD
MIKMAQTPDARPLFGEQELRELARLAGDGEAGLAGRLAARELYIESALPDRVKHLWRFTDPERLLPSSVVSPAAEGGELPGPVAGAAATVDLAPGMAPVLTLGDDLPEGLLSLVSGPDGAESGTGAPVPAHAGKDAGTESLFTYLNRSAWNTGCRLAVKAGAVLPGPVHVRVHAGGASTVARLTVDVGAQAEVVLVEEHLGGGADARVSGHTGITAGAGAKVRHIQVQLWDEGTRGHLSVLGRGGRDADLLTVFASFGGGACKTELVTELAGEGAHSEMVGVGFASQDQHFDVHTRHRHLAGRTTSNIDFKAVAADKARTTYTGLIRIEEEARHCEAFQENRNLLLSSQSRADAIPELEIHNQEVSCSHGATVAPVDREQLFYLESRGLQPSEALGLVVRGFLENTLVRLPEDLRARVETFVGPRLARIRDEVEA